MNIVEAIHMQRDMAKWRLFMINSKDPHQGYAKQAECEGIGAPTEIR